jgi:hypothetical protein
MKHFCGSCGKPTIYNIALPKFCSECGQSFSGSPSINSAVTKVKKIVEPIKPVEEKKKEIDVQNKKAKLGAIGGFKIELNNNNNSNLDSNYDDESYSDDIDSENFDTSKFKNVKASFTVQNFQTKGESFEDLMTQSANSNYKPENIPNNTDYIQQRSSEDILAEFQREAGSIRRE